jgi:hypothetical protein
MAAVLRAAEQRRSGMGGRCASPAAAAAAIVISALLFGCGATASRVDAHDPLAVARAYVKSNLNCSNPDIVYATPPSGIVACKPHPLTRIDVRIVRREGDRVLVATTLDGAPGGSFWLARRDGVYRVDYPIPHG